MNKFEKLIEYIINDEDQKARELFHSIVVEKSRDIYESIMDEESMEEQVHGGQVEDLTNELQDEEALGEDEDEFSLDGDMDNDGDIDGSLPAEHDMDDDTAEHNEIENKVMDIDAKLDELLAKFDDIMGKDNDDMDDMDDMDGGATHADLEGEPEEDTMAEAKQSSKSKIGYKKQGRKMSTVELMREYVDQIGDIYGGQGDATEGTTVGTGTGSPKKVSVHNKSTVGPGADFGGQTATPKGGEQNQDGTRPTKASNEYNKGQGTIKSGNVNVPGGKAGTPKSTGDSYEKGGDNQGDARGNMAGTGAKSEKQGEKNTKSVIVANAGKK
jgi:hypothetical protein